MNLILELQENDWILYDNKPYQIQELSIYQDISGYFPSFKLKTGDGTVGINTWECGISPMPLTEEIKTKNGIPAHSYATRFLFDLNIRFVHELQHIQRAQKNGTIKSIPLHFINEEIVI